MPLYDEELVDELRVIAGRLIQLGCHDEAKALRHKAHALTEGKYVISKHTLADKVADPVLNALKRKLDRVSKPRAGLLGEDYGALEVLAEALVEVVSLNGRVIDKREAWIITSHRMNVALSRMNFTSTYADSSKMLAIANDNSGMLKLC